MATPSNQLLNRSELVNKLGSYSSSTPLMPNADEIEEGWDDAVYIDNASGEIFPNNGQIWPVKSLKYGLSTIGAYKSTIYESINFRNPEWESDDNYAFGTTCTAYNGNSYASSGYYMEDNTNKWYRVTNNGTIYQTGVYSPPYLTVNVEYIEIGRTGQSTGTFNISSNSAWTIDSNFPLYDFVNGGAAGSDSAALALNYYSGSGNTTINVTRGIFTANTAVAIKVQSSVDSDLYAYVIVVPTYNMSNIITTWDPTAAAQSITAISCDYPEISWSGTTSWLRGDGQVLSVTENTSTSSTRPASGRQTVKAIGEIYDFRFYGIEYPGKTVSSSNITVKQEKAIVIIALYVLARKSVPNKVYLSTNSGRVVAPSGGAPADISIILIDVLDGDDNEHIGQADIAEGTSSENIEWDTGTGPTYVSTVLNEGAVDWSNGTAPSGYRLGSSDVIWIA